MKKVLFAIVSALSFNLFSQADSLVFYVSFNDTIIDQVSENLPTGDNRGDFSQSRFLMNNTAYDFNGTGGFVYAAEDLNIADQVTVSAWVKTTAVDNPFFVDRYYWPSDKGFALSMNSGNPQFRGRDNNDVFIDCFTDTIIINDGDWHNLVGVVFEGYWQLWVDGDLVAEVETGHLSSNISASVPVAIGELHNDPAKDRYLNGVIDDVRIFNKALDSVDIKHLFYADISSGKEEVQVTETVTVYDTIKVTETVYDSIAVTDTLYIDVLVNSIGSSVSNQFKVYPNPANDFLLINNGNFVVMSGYTVQIISQTSDVVFESEVDTQLFEISLDDFEGKGLYFVKILDGDNNIIDVRKLILR